MCGIVGVAGLIGPSEEEVFRDMLLFDQVRGIDSTGVVVVEAYSGAVEHVKSLGGATNLYNLGKPPVLNKKGLPVALAKVLIGHNRAATIGGVNEDNAHPFQFGHIIGVHNGTLTQWHDLELDNGKKFATDSMAIFRTLEVKGAEHTWGSFRGAASLVWWDDKEKMLNFLRNDERPMHIAESADGKTLFWASESWMITTACRRRGVKLKAVKKTFKDEKGQEHTSSTITRATEINTHYEWSVSPLRVRCAYATPLTQGKLVSVVYNKRSSSVLNRASHIFSGSYLPKGFLQKYKKSDKSVRGQKFRFSFAGTTYQYGKSLAYFSAFIGEKKDRMEIFPQSKEEEDFLLEQLRENKELTVKHRLRVKKHVYGNGQTLLGTLAHLGFHKVPEEKFEVVKLYKCFGDVAVTKGEWEKKVEERCGSNCGWCDQPLKIEESNQILWYSEAAICPECRSDGIAQAVGMVQ